MKQTLEASQRHTQYGKAPVHIARTLHGRAAIRAGRVRHHKMRGTRTVLFHTADGAVGMLRHGKVYVFDAPIPNWNGRNCRNSADLSDALPPHTFLARLYAIGGHEAIWCRGCGMWRVYEEWTLSCMHDQCFCGSRLIVRTMYSRDRPEGWDYDKVGWHCAMLDYAECERAERNPKYRPRYWGRSKSHTSAATPDTVRHVESHSSDPASYRRELRLGLHEGEGPDAEGSNKRRKTPAHADEADSGCPLIFASRVTVGSSALDEAGKAALIREYGLGEDDPDSPAEFAVEAWKYIKEHSAPPCSRTAV